MITLFIKKCGNLFNLIKLFLLKKKVYDFLQGHSYLEKYHLDLLKNELCAPITHNQTINKVEIFQNRFANIIGTGKVISFGAARMAFFALLKILEIKKNDEIILQGGNCVVMVNAILRVGATPVFVDIDLDTFGTSSVDIESKITTNTKMVIAQHSFGIPCDIYQISKICKKNNIFLLEDCALTFDSRSKSIQVGDFGDASLFSTDRSKPINTFIGGHLYSKNSILISKLKIYRDGLPEFSIDHKKSILKFIIFESKFNNPDLQAKGKLILYFKYLMSKLKLIKFPIPFLLNDNHLNFDNSFYPYPAKFPSFLAIIGIYELDHWEGTKAMRKNLLNELLKLSLDSFILDNLPKAYFDDSLEIVPLRLVFVCKEFKKVISNNTLLNMNSFWFSSPLIGTDVPELFGYIKQDCPNLESTFEYLINIPCTIDKMFQERFLLTLKSLAVK